MTDILMRLQDTRKRMKVSYHPFRRIRELITLLDDSVGEITLLREQNAGWRHIWGRITERFDLPEDASIGKVLEVICDSHAVELAESEIDGRDQEIARLKQE